MCTSSFPHPHRHRATTVPSAPKSWTRAPRMCPINRRSSARTAPSSSRPRSLKRTRTLRPTSYSTGTGGVRQRRSSGCRQPGRRWRAGKAARAARQRRGQEGHRHAEVSAGGQQREDNQIPAQSFNRFSLGKTFAGDRDLSGMTDDEEHCNVVTLLQYTPSRDLTGPHPWGAYPMTVEPHASVDPDPTASSRAGAASSRAAAESAA